MAAGMEAMVGGGEQPAADDADAAAAAIQAIALATLEVERASKEAAHGVDAATTEATAAADASTSAAGKTSEDATLASLKAENASLKASVEKLTAEAAAIEQRLKASGDEQVERADRLKRLESEVGNLHEQLAAAKLEGEEALAAQKAALMAAGAGGAAAGAGSGDTSSAEATTALRRQLDESRAEAEAQERLLRDGLASKASEVEALRTEVSALQLELEETRLEGEMKLHLMARDDKRHRASLEMEEAARRTEEEVEMLRTELVRLRGVSEGQPMDYDPSRGLRPAMTLLERFAAVKREIGIDMGCNMLETIRQARDLLGVEVWSDKALPEQMCDVEDILGLAPPVETIATLPPGPARHISPPTHRTYTLSYQKGQSYRAPSPPTSVGASGVGETPLRISARRAGDEMAKALQEEELSEQLGAIQED